MTNQEMLACLAVLGGLALFTTLFSVWAVRTRRAADAATRTLRASDVMAECGDLLLGSDFVWGVWQDTDKNSMRQLLRDARDETLGMVSMPAVSLDGVLKRFDLAGRRYEIRKPALMSNRTCLHEVGDDTVLYSAEHRTSATLFFAGDGDTELLTVAKVPVWRRVGPIKHDGQEIGKLIIGLKHHQYVSILSLPRERYPLLAQVTVLAMV
jgi:hypothetical protein